MIEVRDISFRIEKKVLVKPVSFSICPGEFVVIMGPNGAGKSTLLKMLSGANKPSTGSILLKGNILGSYRTEELAKQRAVLSQHYHIGFPLTAYDIVLMGRYPYFSHQPSVKDRNIIQQCMERLQVDSLKERNYQTLSGGEAQKVQMCRVLAQLGDDTETEQKLLLLDEPVSHLDIRFQHQLLQEAKQRCYKNVTVIAVLHDINLALKYADRIFFMKEGVLIKALPKEEAITSELLQEVFNAEANIYDIPGTTGKFVAF